MAFITDSLPNQGNTAHYAVSYEDDLPRSDGLEPALDLLGHCEDDMQLMSSWFPGVTYQFAYPIAVHIASGLGGAKWEDPPDIALPFGFNPTVTITAGPSPSSATIRYLLVSEVTEMFMASQRREWFEPTSVFSGADEGSMGESLSRFLGSQLLSSTGISQTIPFGFHVAGLWLNSPREDFVDVAPDDFMPDATTGCGTCFIFFLHNQLGFSIQEIVGAAAPTLAGVYNNLTGKKDGWPAFKSLIDLHYPSDGTTYSPPLDNVFAVADLAAFTAPPQASWVVNVTPNDAWLSLSPAIPVDVKVTLSSDDAQIISLPPSVLVDSSATIPLDIHVQPDGFPGKVVNISASYAGKTLTAAIEVVAPEDLSVAPLEIAPQDNADPCAQHFLAGTPQEFVVTNPRVLADQSGLVYTWSVTGADALVYDAPVFTIPALPAAGTQVTVKVTLRNELHIQASGTYAFTTAEQQTGLLEQLRRLDCSLQRWKTINTQIPPWLPIEDGQIQVSDEQLSRTINVAQQMMKAAQGVLTTARGIEAARRAPGGVAQVAAGSRAWPLAEDGAGGAGAG
jgi:hypothetical protein